MPDPRDQLDLTGTNGAGTPPGARPFLGLWFTCANQYGRAHKLPDGTAYVGRCPRCGASVRFPVGQGGTTERFFRVQCG